MTARLEHTDNPTLNPALGNQLNYIKLVIILITVFLLSFNRLSASEDFRIHDSSSTVVEAVLILPNNRKPIVNNCEQYRHIVEQYDWDTDTMLRVMSLESGCRSEAVGDNHPIRGVLAPSCGLFQVRTIDPKRGTCEQLKDAEFNVQKAYEIYRSQGLRAWSVTHNW